MAFGRAMVRRVSRLWEIYSRLSDVSPSGDSDLEEHYWIAFIEELKDQLPSSIRPADLKDRTDCFIKAVNEPSVESLLKELQSKNLRSCHKF